MTKMKTYKAEEVFDTFINGGFKKISPLMEIDTQYPILYHRQRTNVRRTVAYKSSWGKIYYSNDIPSQIFRFFKKITNRVEVDSYYLGRLINELIYIDSYLDGKSKQQTQFVKSWRSAIELLTDIGDDDTIARLTSFSDGEDKGLTSAALVLLPIGMATGRLGAYAVALKLERDYPDTKFVSAWRIIHPLASTTFDPNCFDEPVRMFYLGPERWLLIPSQHDDCLMQLGVIKISDATRYELPFVFHEQR